MFGGVSSVPNWFYLNSAENLHFFKWLDECVEFTVQWGFKPRLNSDKASDVQDVAFLSAGGCRGF